MTGDLVLLAVGLAVLVGGGEALVRGASALARRAGVSPLVVGLTVVAFGTSAPELAVNLRAAFAGSGELSFGNVVGSNMANVGLVVGIAAVLKPISVPPSIVSREIPMTTLAAVATLVLASDVVLRAGATTNVVDGADGIVLLLLFSVFLYYTIFEAIQQRAASAGQADEGRAKPSIPLNAALTLVGFGGLALGGDLTVEAARELARGFGVSEGLIGLTIVAVGTSLPELVTSIIGVVRGESELALGNAVGSNIFNLLFVLGTTSAILPIDVPEGGLLDLIVVALLSAVLLPLSIRPRVVSRFGGVTLLAGYLVYVSWRAFA